MKKSNFFIDNCLEKLISTTFVFSILFTLLYFVLLKISNTKIALLLTIILFIVSLFTIILKLKRIYFYSEFMLTEKFLNKKNTVKYDWNEVYFSVVNPPSATWSSEKIQIREKRTGKLIFEFSKDREFNGNSNFINFLKDKQIVFKR